MSSPIRDLLDLLHEDWLPEEHRKSLQSMVIELIENMSEDRSDNNGGRWNW